MTQISRARAERCVTHHYGCDCREYRLQEAERERDELTRLLREIGDRPYETAAMRLRIDALLRRSEEAP